MKLPRNAPDKYTVPVLERFGPDRHDKRQIEAYVDDRDLDNLRQREPLYSSAGVLVIPLDDKTDENGKRDPDLNIVLAVGTGGHLWLYFEHWVPIPFCPDLPDREGNAHHHDIEYDFADEDGVECVVFTWEGREVVVPVWTIPDDRDETHGPPGAVPRQPQTPAERRRNGLR